VAVALAAAVWVPKFLSRESGPVEPLPAERPPDEDIVEINYEKIQATPENIFRYALQITPENKIAVQIDDLVHDRHVRKEQAIDPEYVGQLSRSIVESGFFSLEDEYVGIQPNIHEVMDVSVTIGRRTHRSRVENRSEPSVFREVRERIEETGKMELGLWAIQYSPEKLTEMARDAYLLGRKLYDERQIKYGNLFEAIRKFQEVEWLLETVEPKPDFYADALSGITTSQQELQETYEAHKFRSERAIRLRQWEDAATELRIIMDLVPDRSDPRHEDARKKLLDISNRLDRR
jgi:hypothetical protein